MMKILMLSRDASGLDQASATVARWRLLRDAGAELVVLVACSKKDEWNESGLRVRGIGGRAPFTRMWNVWRLARTEAISVDFITAQDPFELGCIAWLVARRSAKRFEIQDHGGFFDGERCDEPLWWIRSRMAQWLMKRASSIRTVSPRSLRTLPSDRAYLLPIAIQEKYTHIERYPERGLIVTVSRLIPVKCVDLLIRAFAEVYAKNAQTRLTIVGDGPERSALERLTHTLGIDSAVTFTGTQDPSSYLSRASLFVSLSLHEGWGVAQVEAACAGVPVLMTDTGCASWLRERGSAEVLSSTTPTMIAERIASLLETPYTHVIPKDVTTPCEVAARQIEMWRSVLQKKPCVLICAQAMDEADPLFGFFVSWVRAFAKKADAIVCALRVSDPVPDCGNNVRIIPLRPRGSRSKIRALVTLLQMSWHEREAYSSVFIRGDAQYVVLCGWLWRLLGKRIVFWYAHYTSSGLWFRVASRCAHEVVTSVQAACAYPRAISIGQGVDETRFLSEEKRTAPQSVSVLIFGRISPSKRVGWMLDQLSRYRSSAQVRVYGTATDVHEAEVVAEAVRRLGATWVDKDVMHEHAPKLYRNHDIFLNATPGSLDKTIVEAMLSHSVVIATSRGYGECLPDDLAWLSPADDQFGEAVFRATQLTAEERQVIGERLCAIALLYHSQTHQIERLVEQL